MNSPRYISPSEVRSARRYSRKEMALRVLWMACSWLFRASPRPFYGFRSWFLRLFGAKIGRACHIANSAYVYYPWNLRMGDEAAVGEWVLIYNLGAVTIGDRATVSHRAHLCAGSHDYRKRDFPLLKPPIEIGAESWVCTDAFVGPNVRVGRGAIVGAASVVIRDVPDGWIVVGNPARLVRERSATAGEAGTSDNQGRHVH